MTTRSRSHVILTLAVVAMASFVLATASANAAIIVVENFGGGSGGTLGGKTADTFDSAITTAGGSATWVAAGNFSDIGVVSVGSAQGAAYLNLGSYVDDAKGTAAGQFDLTMTISQTAGEWISLGFSTLNTPATNQNFTSGSTSGIATIIRREVGDDDLDMFGGPLTGNSVAGPEETGARTLTVSLDFTPVGGYNGAGNYGTVTWSDSILGDLGSYTYTSDESFGSILISEASSSGGTVSALSLSQVPEPATMSLLALGGLAILRRRRRSCRRP